MKYLLALVLLAALAAGLFSMQQHKPVDNSPVTGLPWQIDLLPGGDTRVFGLTPGHTTLGEAIELLGEEDMDLAIIAAPDETGSLEAYYSRYSSGPITGRLILLLDLEPEELAGMRQRAFQDRGTRRYHLHPDDLPLAFTAPVNVINFIPSYNLDEAIARQRFGPPAGIIQVGEQERHLLYPDKGLDLILNANGKEVLQYLPPGRFNSYRARLQQ